MTIRYLDKMLAPGSVALFGASARAGSVGALVAQNLVSAGFSGPLSFVNPKGGEILGRKVFKSVTDLPAAPDLAVIATPPDTIPPLIAELGKAGTRAAVVITAGFGEGGSSEGRARRQAMLDAARPHTLRIVGPNCVGLMVPGIGLNASFAHLSPAAGDIAFVSQSGAVITAVLDWAGGRGIGFSQMVSVGDMADVDFGDLCDFLAGDRHTKSVLLYIEAVTNARKFMSAARALARTKPVVVVKSGRHQAAAAAAASHTGAMAGSDAVYDAAFERAGLVRVLELEELFEAVETLAHATRPRNDGLAIVTNGGGLGVMAVDTLMDLGGRLADLSAETVAALDGVLPATWSRRNPVDIIGDAPGSRYRAALDILGRDRSVGAILAINAPTALASSKEGAEAVVGSEAAAHGALLTAWTGDVGAAPARQAFQEAGIPTFETPDQAVRAFMHLVHYQRGQEALMEVPPALPGRHSHDSAGAAAIIEQALDDGREMLSEIEAKQVLAAYGVPTGKTMFAKDADAAVAVAEEIGYPVAVKIVSHAISHKSDVGGVALDLENGPAVRDAVARMQAGVAKARPDAAIVGYSVQEMVRRPGALECILGAAEDSQFGPVILFGHGGVAAEVVNDKALALPPLNMTLADRLMRRTRIDRLLHGYRDRPPANREAVQAALVRLSDLVADRPEVIELDINPLLVDAEGVVALDARIRVRAPDAARPGDSRFAIRPYPEFLERTIERDDGKRLLLRPIRPEDEPLIQRIFRQLSPEDVRLRFFAPLRKLDRQLAARLTQIDYDREMAFVLMDQPGSGGNAAGEQYGVVRLAADPDFEEAEYAVTVLSRHGRRGFGRLLMEAIIDYARSRGIRRLVGDVLSDNRRMLALAEKLGFRREIDPDNRQVVKTVLDL